jgi:hypothetical protein
MEVECSFSSTFAWICQGETSSAVTLLSLRRAYRVTPLLRFRHFAELTLSLRFYAFVAPLRLQCYAFVTPLNLRCYTFVTPLSLRLRCYAFAPGTRRSGPTGGGRWRP